MNLKEIYPSVICKWKQGFRPASVFFRSAIALTLLISIQTLATPTGSANTARKQIYASAVASTTAALQQEAKKRNWSEYQIKMNVFIPAEAGQYPLCSSPLQASLPSSERLDLSRIRYDIRCDDHGGWDVAVSVKPDIYLPVVLAKNSLVRGQVITSADIQLKKYNISGMRDGYITNLKDVMGMTVKRRLREHQPLTLSQLEAPVMVERGQQVLMIAEHDGIEARTKGEALKKGRKGEVIKVKNTRSGRVVSAVVVDTGTVRMVSASEQ